MHPIMFSQVNCQGSAIFTNYDPQWLPRSNTTSLCPCQHLANSMGRRGQPQRKSQDVTSIWLATKHSSSLPPSLPPSLPLITQPWGPGLSIRLVKCEDIFWRKCQIQWVTNIVPSNEPLILTFNQKTVRIEPARTIRDGFTVVHKAPYKWLMEGFEYGGVTIF